jgi:signal peptidase II
VTIKRARSYDILAILTVLVVVGLDQWTKYLVVTNLSPAESKPPIPLLGPYLVIYYIQNKGAAFGMFLSSPLFLSILIAAAIVVVGYLYLRMINTGPLVYKLVFGLIIGGALGNLLDRAQHAGSVVDFLSFRIPEINFYFAIFNVADACISVGVCLLFLLILFGSFFRKEGKGHTEALHSSTTSGTLRTTEQDVQS